MRLIPILLPLLTLLACKEDALGPDPEGLPPIGDTGAETGAAGDSADTADSAAPAAEGCRAEQQAADRDRLVVASFPYTAAGGQSDSWGAFTLDEAGQLQEGARFELGRTGWGQVSFTPDGEVGLVAQEDGSLGVFRALGPGEVEVVHAAYTGDFYASAALTDASGEWVWIVDGNWAENGGGIYRAAIDCDDGSLGLAERLLEAKLPADLLFLRQRLDRAVLAGREADGAPAGDDASLLELGESLGVLGGADAFGDDEATVSDAAITWDDRYALIGDYSGFSGIPNRVAVVAVADDGLQAVQQIEADDPVALVASPHNDLVLVVSGYSNALFVLAYDPDSATPFSLQGEPAYQGADPQLPSAASLLARGSLKGLVILAENQGLRRVQLEGDGVVNDLGLSSFGSGYDRIPGAVGVQP